MISLAVRALAERLAGLGRPIDGARNDLAAALVGMPHPLAAAAEAGRNALERAVAARHRRDAAQAIIRELIRSIAAVRAPLGAAGIPRHEEA